MAGSGRVIGIPFNTLHRTSQWPSGDSHGCDAPCRGRDDQPDEVQPEGAPAVARLLTHRHLHAAGPAGTQVADWV